MAFIAKFAASKYVGDKLEDHFGPEVSDLRPPVVQHLLLGALCPVSSADDI